MKLKISAIGKLKSGPEQELFTRYMERARSAGTHLGISAISVHEFSESRNANPSQRKQQEAERLISTAAPGGLILAMDEKGKDLTSPQFSRLIADERDAGISELVLVLGGPDGLDASFIRTAKMSIRFGSMTWPHQIARI